MASDPHPEDAVRDSDSERAILGSDPHGPQVIDLLEMQ